MSYPRLADLVAGTWGSGSAFSSPNLNAMGVRRTVAVFVAWQVNAVAPSAVDWNGTALTFAYSSVGLNATVEAWSNTTVAEVSGTTTGPINVYFNGVAQAVQVVGLLFGDADVGTFGQDLDFAVGATATGVAWTATAPSAAGVFSNNFYIGQALMEGYAPQIAGNALQWYGAAVRGMQLTGTSSVNTGNDTSLALSLVRVPLDVATGYAYNSGGPATGVWSGSNVSLGGFKPRYFMRAGHVQGAEG